MRSIKAVLNSGDSAVAEVEFLGDFYSRVEAFEKGQESRAAVVAETEIEDDARRREARMLGLVLAKASAVLGYKIVRGKREIKGMDGVLLADDGQLSVETSMSKEKANILVTIGMAAISGCLGPFVASAFLAVFGTTFGGVIEREEDVTMKTYLGFVAVITALCASAMGAEVLGLGWGVVQFLGTIVVVGMWAVKRQEIARALIKETVRYHEIDAGTKGLVVLRAEFDRADAILGRRALDGARAGRL